MRVGQTAAMAAHPATPPPSYGEWVGKLLGWVGGKAPRVGGWESLVIQWLRSREWFGEPV